MYSYNCKSARVVHIDGLLVGSDNTVAGNSPVYRRILGMLGSA